MATKHLFKLRFQAKTIRDCAKRYPIEYDTEIENVIVPQVKVRGYFLREKFIRLCHSLCETPRSQPKVSSNSADFIKSVTQTALSTPSERLRIEVLALLNGVRWSTASIVLHFCHTEPYPILDVRALWSLGVETSAVVYNFEFWNAYTQFCQELAEEAGVTMRELDRALWQHSKEM